MNLKETLYKVVDRFLSEGIPYANEADALQDFGRWLTIAYGEVPERPPFLDELTEREVQVLKLVAKGMTNHQIGKALNITESTSRNYVANILSKLGVANRAEAAAQVKWLS